MREVIGVVKGWKRLGEVRWVREVWRGCGRLMRLERLEEEREVWRFWERLGEVREVGLERLGEVG